jgi:hypothetical protein
MLVRVDGSRVVGEKKQEATLKDKKATDWQAWAMWCAVNGVCGVCGVCVAAPFSKRGITDALYLRDYRANQPISAHIGCEPVSAACNTRHDGSAGITSPPFQRNPQHHPTELPYP